MSYFTTLYSIFLIVMVLGLALLATSRSNSAGRYKFARVRVWVDENRKRRLPPDDELESGTSYGWFLVSAAFLLLMILWKVFN